MSGSVIVLLHKNDDYQIINDKINDELTVKISHFYSESACYNFMFTNHTDLIVIDEKINANLQDILGFIRSAFKKTFIVVLSEHMGKSLHLMRNGADYIINPNTELDILISIIGRCLERRAFSEPEDQNVTSKNGWKFDYVGCVISNADGKHLKLTLTERDLLKVFFESFDNVCTFESIAGQMGIDPGEAYRHRIEVIVSRLRRKFMKALFVDLPLKSIRGIGYRFTSTAPKPKRRLTELHVSG